MNDNVWVLTAVTPPILQFEGILSNYFFAQIDILLVNAVWSDRDWFSEWSSRVASADHDNDYVLEVEVVYVN